MTVGAIRYTATKLLARQKSGVLKPDSDGYYPLIIGGLNVLNSANEYYVLEGAKELFDTSSILMRRIQNGNLKGEVGHPKRQPGMSGDEYLNRMLRIEETNICSHFKEVWLDEKFGKNNPRFNNPQMVAIMALVKPSGPKAQALAEALENKAENVCFSIRGLTQDQYIRGVNHRILRNILTWDWVTEPGLALANKWDAPALETIESTFITRASLEHALDLPQGLCIEAGDPFIQEALGLLQPKKTAEKPAYHQW